MNAGQPGLRGRCENHRSNLRIGQDGREAARPTMSLNLIDPLTVLPYCLEGGEIAGIEDVLRGLENLALL